MLKKIQIYFQSTDPILSSLLPSFHSVSLQASDTPFESLIESIISQQLSIKAGETIIQRFYTLFPDKQITAEKIILLPREQLRAVGMSWNKADYIQNIARSVVQKDLDFQKVSTLPDSEVIDQLTRIKGIGQWTAEMFLIFTLGREDIFSYGDVGLQNAIKKLYQYKEKPTKQELEKRSTLWKPYRSYASLLLWKSLDTTSIMI